MKNVNLFLLIGAVVMVTLAACGESEAEKQARLQAYQDSLRQAEQAKVAEMMAQMQDSLNAVAAAEAAAEEEEEASNEYNFVEQGPFVVQVGAWRSEDKAQHFVNAWADRNYPSSFVIKHGDEASGDVWFRVRIGFFASQADAETFGAMLAQEINTGYWVANAN